MENELVYRDKNNIIAFSLLENGENLTFSQYNAITRMQLIFGDVVIDSNNTGEGAQMPFDWSNGQKLILDLGAVLTDVVPKLYDVQHIIFSLDNPSGLVWGYIPVIVI